MWLLHGLPSTLLCIYTFDILSLGNCPLVAAETLLGKLVDTFIGGTSSCLDHIQDSTLIRAKSNHFTRNFPDQRRTLRLGL
jgi:hypothetical protein